MTSGQSDIVDISGQVRRWLPSGLSVVFWDGTNEVVLPLSEIDIPEPESRALQKVAMPEWLAMEKGLI